MTAEPYLFGLILLALASVLGEFRNRTAHQHNPLMNRRRWRDGS
jgi:hypothetical protein